jgi:hypothetical protein
MMAILRQYRPSGRLVAFGPQSGKPESDPEQELLMPSMAAPVHVIK